MDQQPVTRGFIIAGGKSSRFGQDKSLYEFEGKPLIMHAYDALSKVFSDISIIANDKEKFSIPGVEVYPDIIPDLGPIGGLYTVLSQLKEGERAFIVPCDMPFLDSDLIEYMANIPAMYDVIVPMPEGNYEPLHAIYSYLSLIHI